MGEPLIHVMTFTNVVEERLPRQHQDRIYEDIICKCIAILLVDLEEDVALKMMRRVSGAGTRSLSNFRLERGREDKIRREWLLCTV